MMNKNVFQRFRPKAREFTETGLSNQVSFQSSRLLNGDGTFNVKRHGRHRWLDLSPSHELITMRWRYFLPLVLAFYTIVNLFFALLYYFIGMDQFMGAIVTNRWEEFTEAFFFSAQTITTVGYGRVNPTGLFPNLVASFEALLGLMTFAIITGLIYGRFSRPMARLMFSENALISPFKTDRALMFRLANKKNNDLTDVEAQVILSMVLYDGQNFQRKYYSLELERSKVNALALSWTVVHPINDQSPLFELTPEQLEEYEAEILVTIKGFDTTFSQTVIGRTSYHHSSLVWNARYLPAFKRSDDGKETILELDKLNRFEKLSSTAEIPGKTA